VSALVAAFGRLRDANPSRLLVHVPAQGHSQSADDIWQDHLAFAARLRASGLRPGELVLFAVGNKGAALPLLLAARSLGLAVLAVDAGTTDVEIRDLCARFGVAVIASPAAASGHGSTRPDRLHGVELTACDATRTTYDDTALLKLTSGSTGVPKAIRATEGQLMTDSRQIVAGMGIGPNDTQVAVIPLSHAYGVSVILVPLILQGTPIVLRESFVPHRLADDARTYGATTFPGVPFMFEHFLTNPPDGGWPDSLSRLISAGARLQPETIRGFFERFGLKIHSFYGASESGGISYDADDEVGSNTVGRPLPGVSIAFRPDEHAPSGAGRVHVTSGGVSAGYVGDAQDGFCEGGYLTGDYGVFDARGRLRLVGRASSFINVAGKKVQPAEVEEVLRQMPGVLDVRVIAAADPQRGEQVAACIVRDAEHRDSVTAMAVRRHCSSRLAAFKIPRAIVLLEAMPLTPRGKLDRRALEEAVDAQINGTAEQLC
jgi:long-chain acyl-CoA synthetase